MRGEGVGRGGSADAEVEADEVAVGDSKFELEPEAPIVVAADDEEDEPVEEVAVAVAAEDKEAAEDDDGGDIQA